MHINLYTINHGIVTWNNTHHCIIILVDTHFGIFKNYNKHLLRKLCNAYNVKMASYTTVLQIPFVKPVAFRSLPPLYPEVFVF